MLNISSIKYINNLQFDYLETYSLQRGGKYDKRIIDDPDFIEFRHLEKKEQLSEIELLKFKKLKKLYGVTQYLIDSDGLFHPSARKTGIYTIDNSLVEDLIKILNTKINTIPNWMCAPVFRDAIVFYNSNNVIVSTLNVCLSCEYMETTLGNYVNADVKTYELLKNFFKTIGHKVED